MGQFGLLAPICMYLSVFKLHTAILSTARAHSLIVISVFVSEGQNCRMLWKYQILAVIFGLLPTFKMISADMFFF